VLLPLLEELPLPDELLLDVLLPELLLELLELLAPLPPPPPQAVKAMAKVAMIR
jgi:hypothetical protein